MKEDAARQLRVPETLAGRRLDQALTELLGEYSRARIQEWIREGRVSVDGRQPRARDRVLGGEQVTVQVVFETETPWQAQRLPLDVLYEDPDILVINKPPGLVVHPAAGNWDGTLVNALLHYAPELAEVPRAGVIHRLDKDTSGLLVVARTPMAHKQLVEQLQAREVKREYAAVVLGVLTGGGRVEAAIGRHPARRTQMAVREGGKPAVTHYRVMERFRAHTWVRVSLETGRTHQIRVHMAHIRHPLVGDPVYGGRLRLPPGCSERLAETLRGFRRQALHAAHLGLNHPRTGQWQEWEAPLPEDMQELIAALRTDAEQAPAAESRA